MLVQEYRMGPRPQTALTFCFFEVNETSSDCKKDSKINGHYFRQLHH